MSKKTWRSKKSTFNSSLIIELINPLGFGPNPWISFLTKPSYSLAQYWAFNFWRPNKKLKKVQSPFTHWPVEQETSFLCFILGKQTLRISRFHLSISVFDLCLSGLIFALVPYRFHSSTRYVYANESRGYSYYFPFLGFRTNLIFRF